MWEWLARWFRPKISRADRCKQFHATYERESLQGNGWRFKDRCPVCRRR
jgi:hypothetical protein